ncbi:MAG: UDP-2,3-diacylglucosamine diphosphatase [Rhodocyclales bacterium RIFCSPLOWO2_02_FULL_63_24]|nr:MAG: UDP-2,3-diacylglucosamine diphosphatase [Rhodocyclales bacterium GWA2_65_19]OHC72639.1 MAG: UDP-2,3-diacylglucosamine diphosphatase [Rhodocyclales bacterium RIFCSPLOWO2_02_FULL_63_24]
MLTIAGTARLVSDLHLRAERPDLTRRFAAFLADTASAKVEALFILGDLFEYWIGDDDLADPFNAQVCALLRNLADRGTKIFFIAGNRDFLIGETFAAAAGMRLLDEIERVGAGGAATLLMHGDTICTDDLPYQQFRRMVRAKEWQSGFLARPLTERRAEVESLRRRSAEAMLGKTAAIMDANPEAIRRALETHGCNRLIHGHTHRPGCEQLDMASGSAERWVLSDWDTGRGDALEIDAAGVRRLDLSS